MKKQGMVFHCGRWMSSDTTFIVKDYPYSGDTLELHPTTCKCCNLTAYAYKILYCLGGSTEVLQADKHSRIKFDTLLRVGTYRILEQFKKDEKPTRGEPIVSEFVRKICRPAEQSAHYLKRIEMAEAS